MEQWPFLSSGWLKNEVVDCNVKKEKRVFNNSNNDFEKSIVVWEWDGWTKRRKERVCCLFTFTFTFHHLLGSFNKVGGNRSYTPKQKVGKKKKTRYSTSVKLSTVKKYLISVLSSTTLLFSYTNFKLAVPHRWLT